MVVLLLSKNDSHLHKEFLKDKRNFNVHLIEDSFDIPEKISSFPKSIVCNDLDFSNINLDEFKTDYPEVKIILFRGRTDFKEGCSALKKKYNGYLPSILNKENLLSFLTSALDNKIVVYPELLEHIIQLVPHRESNENKLLEILSSKEIETLRLVSQGLNNRNIAESLDIQEVTVKKRVSSLLKKLGLKDRLALALFYKQEIIDNKKIA